MGRRSAQILRKGSFTLPLLLLLERVEPVGRDELIARFKAGDASVVADFTKRLHDFPIFEEVVGAFETELMKATEAVETFSDLPPVTAMQKIASLVRTVVVAPEQLKDYSIQFRLENFIDPFALCGRTDETPLGAFRFVGENNAIVGNS